MADGLDLSQLSTCLPEGLGETSWITLIVISCCMPVVEGMDSLSLLLCSYGHKSHRHH